MPVLTVVQNPLAGSNRGVEPDPKLFAIPAGYQVLEANPAPSPPPR